MIQAELTAAPPYRLNLDQLGVGMPPSMPESRCRSSGDRRKIAPAVEVVMTNPLRCCAAPTWVAASLLFLSSFASAQDVATNLEELRLKVGPGATIYVTEEGGEEYTAKVVSLSTSALVVSVNGANREVSESAVRRIRQRLPDPLWTGALIGFGVGVGLGALAAGASESCSSEGGAQCAGPALGMGLLGGGLGLGIDALIKGRKVIYESRSPNAAAWNLVPLVAPRGAGAGVTIVF
jgi:hypothetical protein